MRSQIRTSLSKKLTLIGLALSLAFTFAATAQADAALKKFAGNYKYAKDKAHGEAVIDKALDDALSQLNTVMKMMVKKAIEMRPGRKFMDKVSIETPDGKIGLKIGDFEKVTLKVGKPKQMTREGQTGKVTHTFKTGKVVQTVEGDQGMVKNTFTLSGDGKTLHRDVHISSPRLKKPIKYRLTYIRK